MIACHSMGKNSLRRAAFFVVGVLIFLSGCSSTGLKSEVRHVERYLGTATETHEFQYHVGAEDRQTLALGFDGMLLSFEKALREIVTQPGQRPPGILGTSPEKARVFKARDEFEKNSDAYEIEGGDYDSEKWRVTPNANTMVFAGADVTTKARCAKDILSGRKPNPTIDAQVSCAFMQWQSTKGLPMPDEWGNQILNRLHDSKRLYLSQVFESSLERHPFPYQNNRIRFNIYPSARHISAAARGGEKASSWLGLIRCLPIAGVEAARESQDFHERVCGIADEYRSPYAPPKRGEASSASNFRPCDGKPEDLFLNQYQCWLNDKRLIHGSILSFGHAFIETELPKLLSDKLRAATAASRPYSHIVVVSMGWNTNQLESVENFNSLVRHTLDAQRARFRNTDSDECWQGETCDFRPYVIGLTWPSAWTFETGPIAAARRSASVVTKAYDADELGATWYARLIHVALPKAIELATAGRPNDGSSTKSPQVVLIGHSFGARALTLADASCPFYRQLEECVSRPSVSLAISLNGAFSRARYYPTDGNGVPVSPDAQPISLLGFNDGAPFHPYHLSRSKPGSASWHVNFWSRWDSATSIELPGATTAFVGGSGHFDADMKLLESVSTHVSCGDFLRSIYVRVGMARTDVSAANQRLACRFARDACVGDFSSPNCDDPAHPLPLTSLREQFSSMAGREKRLAFVDASGVIRHTTPLHGGNAHSDIYKWEVGEMIYAAISALAPVKK